MAATSAKPVFTLCFTADLNERELRKLFVVAEVDVIDQTLSHLAHPLVCIALKLLQLFRVHRAAHAAGGGAYVPPDDAAQNQWMANEHDLVVSVQELESEFTTQYVKDKIVARTGSGSAVNTAAKRTMKRYLLLNNFLALRPTSAEQVADIMIATQLQAFITKGSADGPQPY
jgi:hypothetical protein